MEKQNRPVSIKGSIVVICELLPSSYDILKTDCHSALLDAILQRSTCHSNVIESYFYVIIGAQHWSATWEFEH